MCLDFAYFGSYKCDRGKLGAAPHVPVTSKANLAQFLLYKAGRIGQLYPTDLRSSPTRNA